jgi:hypothetical protein
MDFASNACEFAIFDAPGAAAGTDVSISIETVTLFDANFTLVDANCASTNAHCTRFDAHCTPFDALCTRFGALCTRFGAHCTLLDVNQTRTIAQSAPRAHTAA